MGRIGEEDGWECGSPYPFLYIVECVGGGGGGAKHRFGAHKIPDVDPEGKFMAKAC